MTVLFWKNHWLPLKNAKNVWSSFISSQAKTKSFWLKICGWSWFQGTSYSLPVTAIMAHGNHHSSSTWNNPIMLCSWLHLSTKPVLFVYSHQILDWNKHFNSRPQAIMFLWVYSLYRWGNLTTGLLFMVIIHNHKLSCRRLLII